MIKVYIKVWIYKLVMECKRDCGGQVTKVITVKIKELKFLTSLGTWGLKECIQILKIPFFKTYIQKQEEKYVLRYFSASLQNFPMHYRRQGQNRKEKNWKH